MQRVELLEINHQLEERHHEDDRRDHQKGNEQGIYRRPGSPTHQAQGIGGERGEGSRQNDGGCGHQKRVEEPYVEIAARHRVRDAGENRMMRRSEPVAHVFPFGFEGVDQHEVDRQQRKHTEQNQDAVTGAPTDQAS